MLRQPLQNDFDPQARLLEANGIAPDLTTSGDVAAAEVSRVLGGNNLPKH